MQAQTSLVRLFALLGVLVLPSFACAVDAEDADRVALVDKVENQAQIVSASGAATATIGSSSPAR